MKHIHFMGILGSGCSATAAIAKAQGYQVDGCDTSDYSEYRKEIEELGIEVAASHDPSHLSNIEVLVLSPAITHYDKKNPELEEAKKQNIPIRTWQEFSGKELQKDTFVIAIAGTHGKSTTTAMAALLLEDAGFDPTVQLGALIPKWEKNYRVGKGKYFVIEADEYGDNFLHYAPDVIAITNIEYDHPEYFADFDALIHSYEAFCKKLKENGKILVSKSAQEVLAINNTIVITEAAIQLKVPGEFNKNNASVVLAIAQAIGIDKDTAIRSLQSYTGIARRLELVGEKNNVMVFDDYGHHPTAIAETMQAVKETYYDKEIWLVFQPHMFTRTKRLFNDFVSVLKEVPVDHVVLADIFPSRERNDSTISSLDIVKAVNSPSVVYGGSLGDIGKMLSEMVKSNSVVVNMGAGDITKLSQMFLNDLKTQK